MEDLKESAIPIHLCNGCVKKVNECSAFIEKSSSSLRAILCSAKEVSTALAITVFNSPTD